MFFSQLQIFTEDFYEPQITLITLIFNGLISEITTDLTDGTDYADENLNAQAHRIEQIGWRKKKIYSKIYSGNLLRIYFFF